MRRTHRMIRNGAIALTLIIMGILWMYHRNMNEMVQAVDYQMSIEELAVSEKKEKLEALKKEYEQMDSLDYIKKVASSELGMVEKDTIVFKIRE